MSAVDAASPSTGAVPAGGRRVTERACANALLAVALVLAAALDLHLTRGATLGADEYWFFVVDRGFDPTYLLSPHAGNLILVVRALYSAVFALAGPGYTPFRVIEVLLVDLAAVLVGALARRRVSALAAVALAVPLLFLGAAGEVVVAPLGINIVLAVDFGLGALLCLERGRPRSDGLACVLLTLSVASFSVGLAFAVAAAVGVLTSGARRARAYVFVVPLALYGLWLVAAPRYTGPGYLVAAPVRIANLRLVPHFVSGGAAAAAASLTGLYRLAGGPAIAGLGWLAHPAVGYVVLGAGAVALATRGVRGRLARSIWVFLVLGVAFWASVAMAIGINRFPNSTRYLFTGAVVLVLVAAEGLRGLPRRAVLAGCLVFAAVSIALNVGELTTYARELRAAAPYERAAETGMDVAGGDVRRDLLPSALREYAVLVNVGGGVRPYVRAARRWGSPGFTLTELRGEDEPLREVADGMVGYVEAVRLRPAAAPHGGACLTARGARSVRVRPPGVAVRLDRSVTARLARFADRPTFDAGTATVGRWYRLAVAHDGATDPWRLSLPASGATVCALGGRVIVVR